MSTELTQIEDSAALIALQLTQALMQDNALTTAGVVNTFNTIYWGVLEALNPDGWNSTECSPTKTATDSGQTENS